MNQGKGIPAYNDKNTPKTSSTFSEKLAENRRKEKDVDFSTQGLLDLHFPLSATRDFSNKRQHFVHFTSNLEVS